MILHAVWTNRALHLWAEKVARPSTSETIADVRPHAGAATGPALADSLRSLLGEAVEAPHVEVVALELVLPATTDGLPVPSPRLQALLAEDPAEDAILLAAFAVPSLRLAPETAVRLLRRLDEEEHAANAGHDLRFWSLLAQSIGRWIGDQRFVPTLATDPRGFNDARWIPWTGDADARERVARLAASMPPVARCARSGPADAGVAVEQALASWGDALIRGSLLREGFAESIESWSDPRDPHVEWLRGLLGSDGRLPGDAASMLELPRRVRSWLARLEEDVAQGRLHLRFLLEEPEDAPSGDDGPIDRTATRWRLRFGLAASRDADAAWFDARDVWAGQVSIPGGAGSESLPEILLTELAKAARIWSRLEPVLRDAAPSEVDLDTAEVHAFLREHKPVLEEAGFSIDVPSWWGLHSSRVGVRLRLDPTDPNGPVAAGSGVGLDRLVSYRWELVLGGESISFERFRELAADGVPLVKVGDRWVEIRAEDLASARRFLEREVAGTTSLREALRMAHGLDSGEVGLPRAGLESTGWIQELLEGTTAQRIELLEPPQRFLGELRPYQRSGLSWLAFLDRLGMGACLADDMGLGKTIQLIALLQHERERVGASPGPTLIIAPMGVVSNWQRELSRFAPELVVHRHHGLDRPMGDRFLEVAATSDVVLTTYGLVGRDLDLMQRRRWRRVVLDEAQHIKNPPTKQATAIRTLECDQRIALTGTPVENRLGELWSILEFCCPGFLGTTGEFRRRFAMPIERLRDRDAAERLRLLVRPFVLRRLKTDPTVISDLPPLLQSRQTVTLTDEQARLYEATVAGMLRQLDQSEGMRRRGLVLAGLVRLKQICNHPAQFLGEELAEGASAESVAARSGKATRLLEMLEEMFATGDRVLIFTQYRQMGHLLSVLLRRAFDIEPLFLHGGTSSARREQIVERFQSRDPSCPAFVLSLRAGGVGLNLTAASQVVHYDRWWNPAVENQATDRAFRIGQTRTVHVHKMISAGTLEERIDQMIEQKTELAQTVVGAGEAWLTELSTNQLRDLLQLRQQAFEESAA